MAAMAASGRPTAPAPALEETSWAHFVFVRLALDLEPDADGLPAYAPPDPPEPHRDWPDWLAVCRRLTARVERCSPASALLDLGCCTAAEAVGAVQGLVTHLAQLGIPARAGIGPSGCLAELALLRAPASVSQRSQGSPQPISLVSPADAPAMLRTTSVALLPRLRGAAAVTPAVFERLHRYGLRTLGHVARFDALTLHRQFGAPAGSVLAALASGRDLRPLAPTPPPACLRARLCLSSDTAGDAGDAGSAVEPEQVLALLAAFTERIAAQLHQRARAARMLHLTVYWESGARQHVTRTLRQHTRDARLLVAELRRMLVPLLQPGARIADLRLTLLDLAPATPEQHTFWRVRAQRLAALDGMADTLTRRHGRPLLLSPHLVTPDAVFPEERYALTPDRSPVTTAIPPLADTWQPSPQADVRDGQPDAWQEIPHHLHWW